MPKTTRKVKNMADEGVKYFPLDIHMDDNVKLIEAEFGLKGFAILVKLYQKIYGVGYYCEWTNEVALLFAHECGMSESAVSEIVSALIRRGIFDSQMFEKYHILTSEGVQKRYLQIVKRRLSVDFKKEYLLLDDASRYQNVNISSGNVCRTEENTYSFPQSKGKKSKLNKRKEEEDAASAVVAAYESNIGSISGLVYEKLLAWLDNVDASLVLYAIEQAAVNGKCTYSYIEAILNNHFKSGRKTRAEAEQASRKRSEKNADKPKSRYDYDEIERRTFLNVTKGVEL